MNWLKLKWHKLRFKHYSLLPAEDPEKEYRRKSKMMYHGKRVFQILMK